MCFGFWDQLFLYLNLLSSSEVQTCTHILSANISVVMSRLTSVFLSNRPGILSSSYPWTAIFMFSPCLHLESEDMSHWCSHWTERHRTPTHSRYSKASAFFRVVVYNICACERDKRLNAFE